jgi:hypothetical protein
VDEMQQRFNIVKNRVVKKLLSTTTIALMLFATFSVLIFDTAEASGSTENDILIQNQTHYVTIQDVFFTEVFCNVSWEINQVNLTNITFENPGIINYTNTQQGNIFSGGILFGKTLLG